jgi:hypothetical protein
MSRTPGKLRNDLPRQFRYRYELVEFVVFLEFLTTEYRKRFGVGKDKPCES